MLDPDVHTELCEQIHDLLTQAQDLTAYPTQALLIAALSDAEHAAHQMCNDPDPQEGSPT